MPQQPYIPSMSELTQGGNPALGTVQPATNYGDNKGLDLLFRAATQTASYNWAKHQEIEQRKADVFKNIRDLSQVAVMPEDRKVLSEQMGNLLKQITDPSIFTGANEEGRMKFEADTAAWGANVHKSKQDYLNWEIDKKTQAEHPEYQNVPNSQYLDNFPKQPLGSREYNRMIPTPKVDYGVIIKASQVGGVKDVEDRFDIGDYTIENGQPQFKLNPNGHYTQVTTKATAVDEPTIRSNFKKLANEPMFRSVIKPDLDFKFQYDLTPEQRKEFSNPDGTPNYDKLLQSVEDLAVATAVPNAGEKKYEENKFLLQSQKDAAALNRARVHAASQAEPPVTRDVFTGLYRAARYGEGGAKTTNVDGKEVGVNLSSLDLAKQNALLEIGRKSLGNDIGIKDLLLRYDPADGKLKLLDARKITNKTPKRKGWKIPSDAYIVDVNEVDVNLGANQTLGNKSQTEVVKQGQGQPQPQKVQRVIVNAEDF